MACVVCLYQWTNAKKNENEKRSTSIRFVAISFLLSDFVFFWSLLACCGRTTGVYSTQVARPDMLSFYCWREHDKETQRTTDKMQQCVCAFNSFSFSHFVWHLFGKVQANLILKANLLTTSTLYTSTSIVMVVVVALATIENWIVAEQKYQNKRNEKFCREIQIQPEKFKDEATNAFSHFNVRFRCKIYICVALLLGRPHPLAMHGIVVPLSKAIAFACLFVATHHHHSSATTTPTTSDWNEDRTAQ